MTSQYNFSDVVNVEDHSITLSKEFILSKISEENIFEHYGVPIQKGLFCSRLRKDNNPTVALYRSRNGRLLMKDFGSDFCGDCFVYVSELFNVSYYGALKIIANDFGLIKAPKLTKNKAKIKYSGKTIEKQHEAKIRVEIRDWQPYELNWWKAYGISKETLKKFKIFSCKNIWLNDTLFHLESAQQHIFGYYGGIKEGVERWKIYFPGRRKYKFISNWRSSYLQGGKQLPKEGGDYLVITKSMKDCMVLYELGIPAVAPSSENTFITDAQYQKLKDKFKNILILYDNDLPGIQGMQRVKKKYPEAKVCFIPRKYNAKDVSDFYKMYGKDKTIELIELAKKNIILMSKKRSGAYNRNRGTRAELKIVNELKELGFKGVVSSRSESKAADNNKVDIIDKEGKLPCSIQIKHTIATPQYFTIREESTVPNEEFCIIWDKQEKKNVNIVTVGTAVIMDKQLFYKLLKSYAE